MSDVLIVLFAIVVTWCLLIALGIAVLSWRLDKRNRVSPDTPSPAPSSWLVAPGRSAQMHRRLRNAVQMSRLAVPPPTDTDPALSIPHLRLDLEHQAVAIDHHLVVASRMPRPQRRRTLDHLQRDVVNLEGIARRLIELDARPAHLPRSGWTPAERPDAALGRIEEQLHLLAEAKAEIDHVERTGGGLIDADELMARTPPLDPSPLDPSRTAPRSVGRADAALDPDATLSMPSPMPRPVRWDPAPRPTAPRSTPPPASRVPPGRGPHRSTPPHGSRPR